MIQQEKRNHHEQVTQLMQHYGIKLNKWGLYHMGQYKFDIRNNYLNVYKNNIEIISKPMSQTAIINLKMLLNKI